MEKTISEFCDDCMARGFTKHTVETYSSNIKHFLQYTNNPDTISMKDLSQFLIHLRRKKLANSTLNGYFSAISAYVDYLEWIGNVESNPVPLFRHRYLRFKRTYNGTNTRQLISVEMMAKLVYLPLKRTPELVRDYLYTIPERDHAIMMTLAKTGMRRTELWTLNIDDLNLEFNMIYIHEFAKRSNCIAYLDKEGINSMEKYLSWRQQAAKEGITSLWISHTGHKMRKDDIHDLVVFYATILGIHDSTGSLKNKYTTHCFRHWFSTFLRRQGMSRTHRRWLRGDSIEGSDDIYNHVDPLDVLDDYCEYMPKLCKG